LSRKILKEKSLSSGKGHGENRRRPVFSAKSKVAFQKLKLWEGLGNQIVIEQTRGIV
jgi:hypothetical protein